MIGKKILRGVLWICLGVVGLVILVLISLYIPPVQQLILNKTASILYTSTGMRLDAHRFRLRFPLRITLEQTYLTGAGGETLFRAGNMHADVALRSLLTGRIDVSELSVEKGAVHYEDTLSTVVLRAEWDRLLLKKAGMGMFGGNVTIENSALDGARIDLRLTGNPTPEPAETKTKNEPGAIRKIRLGRLDIGQSSFRMHTRPQVSEWSVDLPSGRVEEAVIDLNRKDAEAVLIRLKEGRYAYLYEPDSVSGAPTESEKVSDSKRPDPAKTNEEGWKFRLGQLELQDNAFRYGLMHGTANEGFDPNHIDLSGIETEFRNLRYSSDDWGGSIRKFTAHERSGVTVTEAKGDFEMDSSTMRLNGFNLRTDRSSITADLEISTGLFRREANAPLSAGVEAQLDPAELFLFYRPEERFRRMLANRKINVDGRFEGTLSSLNIHTLNLSIPGQIDFRAEGWAANLTATERLAADLRLNGDIRNPSLLQPFLSDSLRRRMGFPRRMTLGGTLAFSGSAYESDLRLTADAGTLAVRGRADWKRETYDAVLTARDFPLYVFLPHDSLGLLSSVLRAQGNGFDPRREGTASEIEWQIERFDFREYSHRDIALNARLREHILTGRLKSDGEAARMEFDLSGELRPEAYDVRLAGKIDTLDLYGPGFMKTPFGASLLLEAAVSVRSDTAFRAEVAADSIRWRAKSQSGQVPRTTLTAFSATQKTEAAVHSGDLELDFKASLPADSLLPGFARLKTEIQAQLQDRNIDADRINPPPFRLRVSAGRDNILHSVLQATGMDFRSVNLYASAQENRPLYVGAVVNSLKTNAITIDTLNAGLFRNEGRLNYFIRLANRPGNIEQMALIAVGGHVRENRLTANFLQRNRSDSVGFRFGLMAELLDSAVRFQMTPEDPRLAYLPWHVNPDNFVTYRFDRTFEADLRLDGPQSKYIYIRSGPLEPLLQKGAIHLDMKGIDIASTLELLPSPPPFAGILNTGVGLGFNGSQPVSRGRIGVDGLAFQGRRVGDVGVDLDFMPDSLNRTGLAANLSIDGQTVLAAKSFYLPGDERPSFHGTIDSFPMPAVGAFLPPETAGLQGMMNGWITLAGIIQNPLVNGEVNFAEGKINVPLIGTTFGVGETPLRVENNVLDFNRFSLLSPENRPLTLDGTFDFGVLSRAMADLTLSARNFDLINSPRSGSAIHGRALTDIDLTANGRIDALTIRGRIGLLRGTDVTYTMRGSQTDIQRQQQNIVTFVDFSNPESFEASGSGERLQIFGMDLLVNIGIEENINATVNLSDDGNNRAEVAGSGELAYTLNTQGDSRFSGRFNIASGRILYNPPIISQKDFTIQPGSQITWTGYMMNPTFDITAVERMRARVQRQGVAVAGNVNFDVSILIRNTLEDLSVTFGLAAPNNAEIQAELTSLTAEQRSQQAMALMLYNTYTGPGTTASVGTDNPLNAFIERELNTWARNNLRGIDLTFGIDQYSTAAGNHISYSYQLSKQLFNDRVKVSVGGRINTGANAGQNLRDNFLDDIEVEYRLTERDNMFLRLYRYNTQPSILESEVVETGVGFLLRRRMNGLNELFRLMPREDRQKFREFRRELRREREAGRVPELHPESPADNSSGGLAGEPEKTGGNER